MLLLFINTCCTYASTVSDYIQLHIEDGQKCKYQYKQPITSISDKEDKNKKKSNNWSFLIYPTLDDGVGFNGFKCKFTFKI